MQDPLYLLLRHLTSPIVAITSAADGKRNGMISNSAQRASLVPAHPRVSVYISKINYTHELVHATGVFGMHLLRADQFDIIRKLGLRSGRDVHKMKDVPVEIGETGVPLLADCRAALECRVLNAMDAGAATFFLGEIVSVREPSDAPVMTSEVFRREMPQDLREAYEAGLIAAQKQLAAIAEDVQPTRIWKGPTTQP